MSGSMSFNEAVSAAKVVIGPCKRSTLWLVLAKWAREGKPIDSMPVIAAVTSVVGSKAEAVKFIAAVQAVWCKGAK